MEILEQDPSVAPMVAALIAFAVAKRREVTPRPTLAVDAWLVPGAYVYRFFEGFFVGCLNIFFWLPPARRHADVIFRVFVAGALIAGAVTFVRQDAGEGAGRLAGALVIATFLLIAGVAVVVSPLCRARLLREAQVAADNRVADSSLGAAFLGALREAGPAGLERAHRFANRPAKHGGLS